MFKAKMGLALLGVFGAFPMLDQGVISADVTGATVGQNYPRIANLYAFSKDQQVNAMSRYDLVVAGQTPNSAHLLESYKNTGSSKIALMYVPSEEVDLDTYNGQTFGGWAIYPGWWLTLAGTKLSRPVNATTTKIPVENAGIIAKNLPTNADILIDGESMHVITVDTVHNILTVKRGMYSTATNHEGGARVAAHATKWQGTWMLNVTPYCPKDPLSGQTWDDYLVSKTISALDSAPWDGVFYDNTSLNVRWNANGQIDADNNNIPDGGDGPSGTGWADGETFITSHTKQMDPEAIIDGNGSSIISGQSGREFERFSASPDWDSFMNQYLKESSTLSGLGQSNSSIINPDTGNSGVQSLQQMRYGLASALMGNGYFSYDYGPADHGQTWWYDEYDNGAGSSLVSDLSSTATSMKVANGTGSKFHAGDIIMIPDTTGPHNDEQVWVRSVSGDVVNIQRGYDNTVPSFHARLTKVFTQAQLDSGLGWLGQPLSDATVDTVTTQSKLVNGDFSQQLQGWQLMHTKNASATLQFDKSTGSDLESSAHIDVTKSDRSDWHVSFEQKGLALQQGQTYTLSFRVKASGNRPLTVLVQQAHAGWDVFTRQALAVGTQWVNETVTFTAKESDSNAKIVFAVGSTTGDVWLANIKMQSGGGVWRRDFTNGTVLLNPTNQPQTVVVGSGYRHIAGTQDPQLNNGKPVSVVTIPANDAVLLAKMK